MGNRRIYPTKASKWIEFRQSMRGRPVEINEARQVTLFEESVARSYKTISKKAR